ncbi:hypothetical protein MUK42_26721 [Musa troglodytarum]|uniref:Uncharacterized protein n=1 Tax=Musa troglodytarum TaxID=320322 RepID=A0A9E7FIG6_9LILI|nr:hypothetical protein MUK42_26721 [Musa troglodytarum]
MSSHQHPTPRSASPCPETAKSNRSHRESCGTPGRLPSSLLAVYFASSAPSPPPQTHFPWKNSFIRLADVGALHFVLLRMLHHHLAAEVSHPVDVSRRLTFLWDGFIGSRGHPYRCVYVSAHVRLLPLWVPCRQVTVPEVFLWHRVRSTVSDARFHKE